MRNVWAATYVDDCTWGTIRNPKKDSVLYYKYSVYILLYSSIRIDREISVITELQLIDGIACGRSTSK